MPIDVGCNKPPKPCGCSGCDNCSHEQCLFVTYATAVADATASRFSTATDRNSVITALRRATEKAATYLDASIHNALCEAIIKEECLTPCLSYLLNLITPLVLRWAEYYYVMYKRSDDFNLATPKQIDNDKLFSLILLTYDEEAKVAANTFTQKAMTDLRITSCFSYVNKCLCPIDAISAISTPKSIEDDFIDFGFLY